MSSSIYQAWSVTVGEQPTTAYWNILGSNDASFNTGVGMNDDIITFRHLAVDTVPTGIIQAYAGLTAPSAAWLVCDGSAISRTTFSALFAVCGTNYGNGDGSTTFNLPAAAGHVLVGISSADGHFAALGQTGGESVHTISVGELPYWELGVYDPGHGHSLNTFQPHFPNTSAFNINDFSGDAIASLDNAVGGVNGDWYYGHYGVNGSGSNVRVFSNGGNQAHNNLQPYVTVNYIIKT